MNTGYFDEKAIFDIARQIESPGARMNYLEQVCGEDRALRERVAAMVLIGDEHRSFLESPLSPVAATIDHAPLEQPGTRIGPYKLLEQIGEGGMGVVYHASQREPVRRTVALKIIKPGMDSREVVKRFEAERQALAMMDHPNIAKVFDGGATDAGRPYFVMELVRGTPITEYCDRAQLSTRERLELFVTLCHGVQHAHQKGVIHRDLKPSNLLVEVHDVRPVPKIIDFGIAKATGQQLTEQSLHTAFDQMVGTPLYMSPEQAGQSNKDVDTRSDIYSLGVLLYELLTGSTPFEKDTLRTAGFDEMRRIIREVDPPRPSARVSTLQAADLSTISERRHIEPRKLSQQLRGDLDWIVMKAMDKDRERRYESVSALATDVQRYLDDEPVQARPPSLAHHAAKWVRRHRPLVWSTAAVLVIASFAGGSLFWTSYRRAAQLERDAGEHLAAATAFLGSGNYTAADREWTDVRGHLEAAGYRQGPLQEKMAELALPIAAVKRFDEFQATRQRIHSEMYALDRDILDQAQTHCRAALDLIGVFEDKPWKSQAAFQILDAERQSQLDEGAVELLFIWSRLEIGKSDTLPASERTAGYYRAIKALGKIENFHPPIPAVVLWIADCCEAIGDQQASAEARTRAESLKPTSATDHYLLGEYHAQHGQQDEALASYWQALARQPDHYLSLLAAGVALGELKEYKSAEAMLTGAIAMNPHTVIAYLKRATARREQSKIVLAMADVEEAKKRDPELARALLRRADEYRGNLQLDKALADYSDAIRLDPQATAYLGRGITYAFQGDLEKALADCNENIRLAPESAGAYAVRAEIYRLQGDMVRALADANESLRLDPKYAWAYLYRGRIYAHQRAWDKVLADLNEAIHLDSKEGSFRVSRGEIYWQMGEREKALADYQEGIRLDPKQLWGHCDLAVYYRGNGDLDKALAAVDEAVRIAPEYAPVYILRATIHNAKGIFDKALADCNEAIRLSPNYPGGWTARASVYRDQGDVEKALADYNEAIRLAPKNTGAYTARAEFSWERGDVAQAAADYDRAAELGPISWHFYKRAGLAHFQLQHYDKALEYIAKAVELNPGDGSNLWWIPPAAVAKCPDERLRQGLLELADKSVEASQGKAETYAARARLFDAFGRGDEARIDFDKALELAPTEPLFWEWQAPFHAEHARWNEMVADLTKLIELQPERIDCWYQRCLARLGGGQADEYRRDCGEMLQRLGSTDSVNDAYYVAWTCTLAPDATTDWATAVALAEKTVQSDPKSATYLNTLGAVLYRAGRFDEALARLSEVEALVAEPQAINSPPAYTWFFLAMTQHRLGNADVAKQWLDKAVAWTDKTFAEADQGTAYLPWNRQITLKVLRDEATAMLGVTLPTAEPAPEPAAKVEETQESPKSTPAPEAPKEEEKPQ